MVLDFVIAEPAPGIEAIGGGEIIDGNYVIMSSALPLPSTALLAALGRLIPGRFRRV